MARIWLTAAAAMASVCLHACTTSPQLAPELAGQRDALLAAMRDAAKYPVPKRSLLYTISAGWDDTPYGAVVAVDGAMIAVRMEDPDLTDDYFHSVVPISTGRDGIKGDGIVVSKFDGLLVCRYFESPCGPGRDVLLGDQAHVQVGTSLALQKSIRAGTAEWFTP